MCVGGDALRHHQYSRGVWALEYGSVFNSEPLVSPTTMIVAIDVGPFG